MLRLSKSYCDKPILSLRSGGNIGHATTPIINPNNLRIEGWYCTQRYEKEEFILPVSEVRDIISKGIIVNDHDSLTPPEDMVRLKSVIQLRFEVIGKNIKTENKNKLGKVTDYAVADESTYIQKLYVQPTLFRGLSQNTFIIDREVIVEINDKDIIVKEASVNVKSGVAIPLQA